MTEDRVREIVGDAMTGMYKRIDALSKKVDALAERVNTPTEHKIQQVGQIDKLQADIDGVTDERNGAIELVRHSGLGAIAKECHKLAVARGKYEGEHPIEKALKDLAGEVIELAAEHAIDVYTEEIGRGAGPTQHTRDEFGDVMANLLSLAVEMDIDPETALRDTMQRNAQRAREGV